MYIIQDEFDHEEFVRLAEGNVHGELKRGTPFCKERYSNLFIEVIWRDDEDLPLRDHQISVPMMDIIQQSKKIRMLKSFGIYFCFLVAWKQCGNVTDNTDDSRSDTYQTSCHILDLQNFKPYSFVCSNVTIETKSWHDNRFKNSPSMYEKYAGKFIRQYELHCNRLHHTKQQRDALESRVKTHTAALEDRVWNQFRHLYRNNETTSHKLTSHASVSKHFKNQLYIIRAEVEHLQSVFNTLQDSHNTTQEMIRTESENRNNWTSCIMSELQQHDTYVCTLRTECNTFRTMLRKYMEDHQKDTKWKHICAYLAGLLFIRCLLV